MPAEFESIFPLLNKDVLKRRAAMFSLDSPVRVSRITVSLVKDFPVPKHPKYVLMIELTGSLQFKEKDFLEVFVDTSKLLNRAKRLFLVPDVYKGAIPTDDDIENEWEIYFPNEGEERTEVNKFVQGKMLSGNIDRLHMWELYPGSQARKAKEHKLESMILKLPANTTWEDITIQFTSGHDVKITFADSTIGMHRFNYAEMGFADKRTNNPNTQWHLLSLLAENNGSLSWQDSEASDRFKKQKQILTSKLRSFFTLEEDPFYDYREKGAYITRFNILPES